MKEIKWLMDNTNHIFIEVDGVKSQVWWEDENEGRVILVGDEVDKTN